jgi:acetolactate synthase-1/2/3 large subunit
VFRSQRPRPVHIEIPIDVLAMSADSVASVLPTIPDRPGPNSAVIEHAAEILRFAKEPMVWLGGGAKDASDEALRLIEFLDAPTVNTTNGSGTLLTSHPLCVGLNIGFRVVADALKQADVVLTVGTEISETDTFIDGLKFEFNGKLIRIDIDPGQLSRNWPADLAIMSDARLALAALNRALGVPPETKPAPDSDGARRTAELRRWVKESWWPECAPQKRIMDTIRKALPRVIIVGDSTQLIYNALHSLECSRPRSFFHSATGFGTLGYALPAAIGAKLAKPDRPIAAVIGDGGIQFTLAELASAVEAKAPVVVLLWNNGGYGEIRRCMRTREISPIGTQTYTPDFLAIAKGFGCLAERATGVEHLDELLQAANQAKVPTLIEIREDAEFLFEK